jgi:hypothetical protein
MAGSASRRCLSNGEWSGEIPSCDNIIACGPLADPGNGRVEVQGNRLGNDLYGIGSLAIYSCNNPYEIVGSQIRQCRQEGWTGNAPTCKAPVCVNTREVFSMCASPCHPTCDNPSPVCFVSCRPGCMCPLGYVLNEATSSCVPKDDCPTLPPPTTLPPVGFELRGIFYPNNTRVRLSQIGERDNALIFRTDYQNCCQSQRLGECYGPQSVSQAVSVRARKEELYRNRGVQLIRINRQTSPSRAVVGLYCCHVPTGPTTVNNVCVNIVA